MLVTRIIGKCPECKRENSFGNVNIHQNWLLRGCTHCKYSIEIPLPELSKKIIYLDQFFLSHAFRAKLKQFVDATDIISGLAQNQLVVCPHSPFHKTETLQWRHDKKEQLLDFIKRASHGHKFYPEYKIKITQITNSFQRYLENDEKEFSVNLRDALPVEINLWDDYFWIDVNGVPEDTEEIRKSKEDAVDQLVELFRNWRTQKTTFEQDQRHELISGANAYLQLYMEMTQRFANGDVAAILDSPIYTKIVEYLLHFNKDEMDINNRLKRIVQFFNSAYYYETPCEFISTGLFAALKQKVKNGHYTNAEKAKEKLSGIFNDINIISTYAPYCDAMFIDNQMFDFIKVPELNLEAKFNTIFFARKTWDEFMDYLIKIKGQKNKEIDWALRLVHG